MRVALCGRVALEALDGREVELSRPQLQACLAVLVVERHRSLTREELAHLLWGEPLSSHWKGALRGVVAKLRSALAEAGEDPGRLRSAGGLLALELPDGTTVDVEEARDGVRAAEAALSSGLASDAARAAETATAVLARGFLPMVDLAWADERRWELSALRRRAERALGRARLTEGRPAEAVDVARRLVADDPFDDAARALLLRGLGASGDVGGVRRAYDEYVAVLRQELGVGPTAELTGVRDALLAAGSPPSTARGPDPGATTGGDGRRLFVGRAQLLDELLAAVPPPGGTAAVVVLEGEAGAGKTRLAEELATTAAVTGRAECVLWGRSTPHAPVPFEPVAGALRRAWAEDGTVAARLGDLGDALAPLAADGRPARRRPVGADDRPSLFTAVATAVDRLAEVPLVWVLDDLQWADPDTLALLDHVVSGIADRPVLLVATTRPRPAPVAAALARLARAVPTRTHRIAGLDAAAVGDWLRQAGVAVDDDGAGRLQRRTGGNALFIAEVVEAARTAGGTFDPDLVPPALREVLTGRLAMLVPEELTVLEVAALAGDVVAPDLVVEVSGLGEAEVDRAVRTLGREHLVVEVPDGVQFTHDVVRDVVIEALGSARCAWLHLRLATALAGRPPAPGRASALARHFGAAGPGHADDARRWAVAAAREAADHGAWATAGGLAADVLADLAAAPDDRIDGLVVRARAQRGLGDVAGADATLDEAIGLARLHGRARAFAGAVLERTGGGGRGVPDAARFRRVALVEEALAGLGDADDDLRVPLLGSLAVALLLTDRDDDRRRAATEALDRARRAGDAGLMARALLDHRFALGADRARQRLREAEEAVALGERSQLPEVVSAALAYRQEDLLLLGERAAAAAALEQTGEHLRRFPDPYWSWVVDTWRALHLVLDGRLDDAEAAAVAAAERAAGQPQAGACLGVTTVMLRMHQGRADEVVDLLAAAAAANPEVPAYRAVLALARAQVGEHAEAARLLAAFAADGFAAVPDDTNRLLTFAVLADVAVAVGDASVAPPLGEELARHRGLLVLLNCYGGGGAVWGPVSAHLAALAELAGDDDAAATWHGEAVAEARRIGDRPYLERLTADPVR